MMNYCYNDNGKINADNLPKIQRQDWFEKAGNLTLYFMLHEDPFHYTAGEVTVAEEQWAIGLCSDVYGYAGYSLLSASYETGREDGTAYAKGAASVLEENIYAQNTDYLSTQLEAKLGYAEGDAKAGWSKDYVGARAEGDVGVAKIDTDTILGSEQLNLSIKGNAEVLTADAKAAFEFEDAGQYAIGFDLGATLAKASASLGLNIFEIEIKDQETEDIIVDNKSLLGFDLKASASAGVGAALWLESNTAYEMKFANINATEIKIDLEALIGVEVSISVPTPYIKPPWQW